MTKHAVLGASSAHRWMPCPGSVRLSAGREKSSSTYAKEGTAAHELAAACLRAEEDPFSHVGEEIQVEGETFPVTEEMAEAVMEYMQAVLGDYRPGTDVLVVERTFDLGKIHPGMFGTCDAAVYQPDTKILRVYDLKYGKGHAVEVEENPQALYYGLGAMIDLQQPVDEIELIIAQPRCPHPKGRIRRWRTDTMFLIGWTNELREYARATEQPKAPLNPGEHCGFCPAAGVCPAVRERSLEVARAGFAAHPVTWTPPAPETLTPDQVAAVLRRAEEVKDWVAAVQKHAHAEAEAGRIPAGFKLVDRRATRKWIDQQDTVKWLKEKGLSSLDFRHEPELKSPAQIEPVIQKKMGCTKKEAAEMIEDLVSKISSGTNLVQDADVRPEVRAAVERAFTPITGGGTAPLPWN